MAISDKTRKLLWGKSGNRCAICKCKLIQDLTETDDFSVVGDECHIVSSQTMGPRYDERCPLEEINGYNNFLLLCKAHHKIVDDQPATYTANFLREIKIHHENSIAATLDIKESNLAIPSFLFRVTTGQEVGNILSWAEAYEMANDEPKNDDEMGLVRDFLDYLHDYGETINDLNQGKKVEFNYEISKEIKNLENAGFWVFGGLFPKEFKGFGKAGILKVAVIRVIRSNNQLIFRIDSKEVMV